MAVNLSPVGGVAAQFFDNDGNVLSGGKIFTYSAGTNTPAATYTTSAGSIAHSNPIILDSAGRVPSGEIWLTDGINYKFVLNNSSNVLIGTYDNISGINSNFLAFVNQQQIITATANQTVFNLSINYQPGTNSLSVFVDGVNQYGPGAQYAYTETDSDTVTFVSGLHVGAQVKFTTSQQQGAGAVDASQVSYDPPFTDSVATNVEAKLAQTVSVMDFGAVGDGATDDTDAIQNAIDTGNSLYFPEGTYKITGLTVSNKSNVRYFGYNNVKLTNVGVTGTTSLFNMSGTLTNVLWDGIEFVGDNTTGAYNNGIACSSGQTLTGLVIRNCIFRNLRLGVSLNADLSGAINGCTIDTCFFYDIVGADPGEGYAIHLPNAIRTTVSNCKFDNTGRHDIYIPKGGYCNITNCISVNHRSTTYTDSIRPAFLIAGDSSYVNIDSCIFKAYYDCAVNFLGSTGGAGDNAFNSLTNCCFDDAKNSVPTVVVGEQLEPTTIFTRNINIVGNRFNDTLPTSAPFISVLNGQEILIKDNQMKLAGVTATEILISLGSSSYSANVNSCKRITVVDNNYTVTGASGTAYLVGLSGYIGANVDQSIWIDTKFYEISGGVSAVVWGSPTSGYANIGVQGALGRGARSSIVYIASIPTTGTWAVGDIAYNISPTSGGYVGWVCTTAGTPGTWKTFGLIS
jgi:hypothetical protein